MSDDQNTDEQEQDEAKAKEERRQTRLGCGFVLALVVAAIAAIVLIVGRGKEPAQESVKSSPASCEMLRQDMLGRVEDWRADGRVRWKIQPLSRWSAVRLP